MSYVQNSKFSISPNLTTEERIATTIAAYENGIFEYVKKTPQSYQLYHLAMLRWIKTALTFIQKGGSVLEVGSATPRDANFIRSRGYQVQCSDATQGFVDYLKEQGEKALLLNLLTMPIRGHYDMIFANAVAPHFTKAELEQVLKKIRKALKQNKILTFNVKRGDGELWVEEKLKDKRFVHYWQPSEIESLVKSCGFDILFIDKNAQGDLPTHEWINIITRAN